MLFKRDIVKILQKLDLPRGEYWITAGAALVLHGVKDATSDIDLGCTTSLAEYFIKRGCNYKVLEDATRIVEVSDTVEILENWFVEEIKYIDNIPVGSIESIRKQKQELGRAKDIDDIKLIDEYLANIITP